MATNPSSHSSVSPQTTSSVHHGFPWEHIIGFVLSLILTGGTMWFVLGHHMHGGPLITVIMLLAVLQIFIQLFMFMHLTESDGTRLHVWMILLGFFFTFVVVAASIWIMSFSSMAA